MTYSDVHKSENKPKILLGITGSIAAYKTPDLLRRFLEAGFEIKVVLTHSAKSFVSELVLETLLPGRVFQELLEPSMQHIKLGKWADLILIAPTSANTLAKLAHGFSDDLLSATCLASKAKLVLVPGMNQAMWDSPATKENIKTLKNRGAELLGPDSGVQACGDVGPGRMIEPSEVLSYVSSFNVEKVLTGKKILITAGPTQELIDPVRFISNRSSGKMGYALVSQAILLGAEVTLITGPVNLETPYGCKKIIKVRTACEMKEAVDAEIESQDIFISAAAVADYQLEEISVHKIKKSTDDLMIKLKPTVDILAEVGKKNLNIFVVGFAAETENLIENARHKLIRKNANMIIANDVSRLDIGFDAEENEVFVIMKENEVALEKADKKKIASLLLNLIAEAVLAAQALRDLRKNIQSTSSTEWMQYRHEGRP